MSVRNQRLGQGRERSGAYTRLLPWQVRERRIAPVRLGRRGLDPDEVYRFLDRVAGELAAVHAALAVSRREAAVVVDALRRRQSGRSWPGGARGCDR